MLVYRAALQELPDEDRSPLVQELVDLGRQRRAENDGIVPHVAVQAVLLLGTARRLRKLGAISCHSFCLGYLFDTSWLPVGYLLAISWLPFSLPFDYVWLSISAYISECLARILPRHRVEDGVRLAALRADVPEVAPHHDGAERLGVYL